MSVLRWNTTEIGNINGDNIFLLDNTVNDYEENSCIQKMLIMWAPMAAWVLTVTDNLIHTFSSFNYILYILWDVNDGIGDVVKLQKIRRYDTNFCVPGKHWGMQRYQVLVDFV